jgi:hypothetical protein
MKLKRKSDRLTMTILWSFMYFIHDVKWSSPMYGSKPSYMSQPATPAETC